MRIFLAYPFTQLLVPESGLVEPRATSFLLTAVEELTRRGHSVFSAHRREAFGKELMAPDVATFLDYEEMCKADYVVAFPGNKLISGGVHIELGWAAAMRKPIAMFLAHTQSYSPLVTGLHKITEVKYIFFHEDGDDVLVTRVVAEIDRVMEATRV